MLRRLSQGNTQGLSTAALRVVGGTLVLGHAAVVQWMVGLSSFGRFAYALAIAQVLAVAASGNANLALRDVSRTEDVNTRSHVTERALLASLAIGVVAAVAAVPVGLALQQSPLLIAGMVTFILAQPLLLTMQGALRGFGLMREGQLPNEIIKPLGALLASFLLMMTSGRFRTPEAALLIFDGALLLAVAAACRSLLRCGVSLNRVPNVSEVVQAIRASVPFSAVTIATALSDRTDLLVVGYFASDSATGLYALAQRILPLLLLSQNVTIYLRAPAISSQAARHSISELRKTLRRVTTVSLLGTSGFGACVWLGSLVIASLSQDYADLPNLIILFVVACLANSVIGGAATFLLMSNHEMSVALSWMLAAVIIAVMGWFLCPYYGALGGALAFVAGTGAAAVAMSYQTRVVLHRMA